MKLSNAKVQRALHPDRPYIGFVSMNREAVREWVQAARAAGATVTDVRGLLLVGEGFHVFVRAALVLVGEHRPGAGKGER